ncbi:MAG: hypothetical protein KME45_26790 [Stenomitos rutilans HA7619-LM2]|jgi:hypothetical protein|nr:hypothetical protein [Stenomitos rutilans HA7619-LM2]
MTQAAADTQRIDLRFSATKWVWGLSVLSLLLCVPLIEITKSGVILPCLIIATSGFSSIAIWIAGKPSENRLSEQIGYLQRRIEILEAVACSEGLEANFKVLNKER